MRDAENSSKRRQEKAARVRLFRRAGREGRALRYLVKQLSRDGPRLLFRDAVSRRLYHNADVVQHRVKNRGPAPVPQK